MSALKVGTRATFHHGRRTSDPHQGATCTVTGPFFLPEGASGYRVTFDDGTMGVAFADELTPLPEPTKETP